MYNGFVITTDFRKNVKYPVLPVGQGIMENNGSVENTLNYLNKYALFKLRYI
jgi:hypothetical protein